jgi:phenylpropionate dioxygenase-like ring-hydroxylating dioxygenase large terminal subunit
MMDFRSFWYVVAQSAELGKNTVLSRVILGEHLAVFRGENGQPAALRDRCMHRNAPLSKGRARDGRLRCPYHGWTYDHRGVVVAVPAEGEAFRHSERRCAHRFDTLEQDGFVYVRLDPDAPAEIRPYAMPRWGEPGWRHIRLVNRFENNVTNCAENFIDIPHTVFVHPGIFRTRRDQQIEAEIVRRAGSVHVDYRGETSNLGWFSRFLNAAGGAITHRDNFHMPNVTEVEYVFGPRRRLFIVSQSIPESDDSTLVYTTLTYDFGLFSRLRPLDAIARRILAYQGQAVIDQDVAALKLQMDVIRRYGAEFNNTSADAIHVLVESIRDALAAGQDPRELPEKRARVTFRV